MTRKKMRDFLYVCQSFRFYNKNKVEVKSKKLWTSLDSPKVKFRTKVPLSKPFLISHIYELNTILTEYSDRGVGIH